MTNAHVNPLSIQERAGRCFLLIMLPTSTIMDFMDWSKEAHVAHVASGAPCRGREDSLAWPDQEDFHRRVASELALREANKARQVLPEEWYQLNGHTRVELIAQRMLATGESESDGWSGWNCLKSEAEYMKDQLPSVIASFTCSSRTPCNECCVASEAG